MPADALTGRQLIPDLPKRFSGDKTGFQDQPTGGSHYWESNEVSQRSTPA